MLQYPFLVAAGSIAAAGTVVWAKGCSIADTGTGDTRINLDEPVDATECAVLVTLRGATSGIVRVVQTSDIAKDIKRFAVDGTTATDLDFDFMVLRAPGG